MPLPLNRLGLTGFGASGFGFYLGVQLLVLLVLAKNLREVSLLADQTRNRLSEGHRKSIRIPANYPTGYLKGFVKIKQWEFS